MISTLWESSLVNHYPCKELMVELKLLASVCFTTQLPSLMINISLRDVACHLVSKEKLVFSKDLVTSDLTLLNGGVKMEVFF